MSYILDALRRADAERERGSVPGIHAQPAVLGEADVEAARSTRPWLWGGVVLTLLVLAALGWWLLAGPTPPQAAEPVRVAPVPVPLQSPVSPAAEPPSMPAPALVNALPPAPVPAKAEAPQVARPASDAVPKATSRAAPASAAAVAEPRIYQLSELPDEIRRELPMLAVGGAMYSQNPANRMLIVNGQTFKEGDKLGPNLSLEQIRLKSAVLDYKGYRYGITY